MKHALSLSTLVAMLMWTMLAWGQPTYDTAASVADEDGTGSFNLTVANQPNRLLLCCASIDAQTDAITSMTYGGETLTLLLREAHDSVALSCELWSKVNPLIGTNSVAFAVADQVVVGCASFNNVLQATPVSGTTSSEGTSGPASITVASATTGTVLDCHCNAAPGGGPTVGDGQTEIVNTASTTNLLGMSTEAGATSVDMTWSFGALNWVEIGTSINELPARRRTRVTFMGK
jgi:hypothetical protein